MIDGMKVHIKTEELAKLLRERAGYHTKRALQKGKEIPQLQRSMKALDRAPKGHVVSNSTRGYGVDPVEELESQIRSHKKKATALNFLATHLAKGETYALTEAELRQLELLVE
jgi:hypothetical protein